MKILIEVEINTEDLPDYEYSADDIAESTGADIAEVMKELKVEDPETKIRKPVPPEDIEMFKKNLVDYIKVDIKNLLEDYRCGDIETPSLSETIDEAGNVIYSAEMEDLSDLVDVSFKVIDEDIVG